MLKNPYCGCPRVVPIERGYVWGEGGQPPPRAPPPFSPWDLFSCGNTGSQKGRYLWLDDALHAQRGLVNHVITL